MSKRQQTSRAFPLLVGRAPKALIREASAVARTLHIKKTALVRVAVEHFCRAVRAGRVAL